MRYLSVCSGIEAATVAWHDLGWTPAGFSEIEKFPSQVLAHHYPAVQNFGDMTRYKEWDIETDNIGLLVGGTPCQSFSVAGLRKGLDDPRGNLALTFCGIADHFRPTWIVWENVPGVLSSNEGRDFGSFIGALAKLGYGVCYRVLDAQYFGVAQRRRRVFVVGCARGWRHSAAVLFERESLRRDTAPSREKGERTSREFIPSIASCLETTSHDYSRADGFTAIAFENNRRDGARVHGDVTQTLQAFCGTGGGNTPMVAQPITQYGSVAGSLTARHDSSPCADRGANVVAQPVPINTQIGLRGADTSNTSREGLGIGREGDPMFTLQAAHSHAVAQSMAVRRLTPVECERLQGFPDNYTNIKNPTPDGPRYKALGNSMAVPVMRWIGERIDAVTKLSI